MRLEGKVALISGGARGMGAVEAKLFVKNLSKINTALLQLNHVGA